MAWLWLENLKEQEVEIRGDSQLIIRQLTGVYAVRAPTLMPLYEQAKRGLAGLRRPTLTWIRREENKEADALSKRAYSLHKRDHITCIARNMKARWEQ